MPDGTELVAAVLPGRGARRDEPLVRRLEPLADELAAAVLADVAVAAPDHIAVYGHSLGALLAHAIAVRVQDQLPQLETVVVSGSRAPSRRPPVLLHELDDAELLRMLTWMGGLPQRRRTDAGFVRDWLPVVRTDLAVCETYLPTDVPPLRCRVISWAGSGDWYAPPSEVRRWSAVSAAPRRSVVFPGGHFFLPGLAGVVPLLTEIGWSRVSASTSPERAA